jgi:uncharacterized protein (TIGR03086 family)
MKNERLVELTREALSRFGALVGTVSEEGLDDPTPCAEWTVRDLVEHTVGLTHGMAEALRAGDASRAAFRPRPSAEWPGAEQAMAEALEHLPHPTLQARVRVLPVSDEATFSPEDVVRIHLLDLVVHTWDLARALRLDHDPGEAAPALVDLAALVAARIVPSTRHQFGPPIVTAEVSTDAWPRLLRLLGRDPGWQPPGRDGASPELSPVGIAERLARFDECWSPKIIARLNDHEVKVVKMSGTFDWHTHPDTDELFLVVTGRMRIEMRHGHVELGPGDLYVVPRGVVHRPVATEPTESVLLEPAGVVNTGDAGGRLTAVDQILA